MIYTEIIEKEKELLEKTSNLREKYNNDEGIIKNRTISFLKIIAICLGILSIVIGITIGSSLYRHEVKGLNTVCYTTDTGKCYHSGSCGYLRQSSHKTNVYSAKKRGYKSCSRCSVGKLDISEKNEIGYGLLTTFGVSAVIIVLIATYRKKKDNKKQEGLKKEKDEKIGLLEKEFDDYLTNEVKKNGILKIIDAPVHMQLKDGKLYSSKENIYRYIGQFGECYHISRKCIKGISAEVLVFELIGKYYPCGKCKSYYSDTVPEWYKRYKKLQLLLKESENRNCTL